MHKWPADNTFLSVRNWLVNRLAVADTEPREKELWVRLLLEWQSGKSRAQLLTEGFRFSESQLNRLDAAAVRLVNGEPLQHITSEAWFFGRPFQVTPDVLIPRPETEELVSLVLGHLPAQPERRLLDIGTGSGCIPITVKLENPQVSVEAWDVSEAALSVADFNAKALDASVRFERRDVLQANVEDTFSIVVSNPPYITKTEVMQLDRRVRDYEPELALAVPDDDPLLFYRRIIHLCFRQENPLLTTRGQLWFECHERYTGDVAEMCEKVGKTMLFKDAQQKERFVFVQKTDSRVLPFRH